MLNSLIKINSDFNVDFSFIDKILVHMISLKKEQMLEALKIDYVEYYPPVRQKETFTYCEDCIKRSRSNKAANVNCQHESKYENIKPILIKK